jgi:hypothetical protein
LGSDRSPSSDSADHARDGQHDCIDRVTCIARLLSRLPAPLFCTAASFPGRHEASG